MALTTFYLIDSAACITPVMAGSVVVTGSHGGDSAAGFALAALQTWFEDAVALDHEMALLSGRVSKAKSG